MNILVLSPYLPHPLCGHGGGIVIHRMIRALAARHGVDLACFVRDAGELDLAGDLRGVCRRTWIVQHDYEHLPKARRLANLMGPNPSYVAHAEHPEMRAAIAEALRSGPYDAVQIEFIFLAGYAKAIRHPALFLDTIDTYAKQWRGMLAASRPGPLGRLYWLIDGWKSDSFTMRVLRRFSGILAFTPEDRRWIHDRDPRLPVHLRRAGVDLPGEVRRPDMPGERILFVGSFKHPANADGLDFFLDEVFPALRARRPGVSLAIAGAPAPERLRGRPGVEVLGFVGDLAPLYSGADLCVAPIRFGGGIKTKVLDAMAHAVPVVTMPAATEGIGAAEGQEIAVARDGAEYVRRIEELLADPDRARRMGHAGRAFVEREHGIERVIADIEEAYRTGQQRTRTKPRLPGSPAGS